MAILAIGIRKAGRIGGHDALNSYSSPGRGQNNAMSANDITLMEALGWSTQVQRNGSVLSPQLLPKPFKVGPAVTLLTTAPVINDTAKTSLASGAIKIREW